MIIKKSIKSLPKETILNVYKAPASAINLNKKATKAPVINTL